MMLCGTDESPVLGKALNPVPLLLQQCQFRNINYHVFLSFAGDTRKNFTDNLYAAFQRRGIVTFRDDKAVERGKALRHTLMQAIEQSLFAVVILSNDYASSSWCLKELHKIVVESGKHLGSTIFPIFSGVDPSHVRHQKGDIGRAFANHENNYKQDKVQRWRNALTHVANLSGWDARDQ